MSLLEYPMFFFGKYSLVISLYYFRYSGITENDLRDVTTTLKDVQEKIKEIIPPDAILVGHSLDFDFASLRVSVSLSSV